MNLAFFVTSWPGRIVALGLGLGIIFGATRVAGVGQATPSVAPRTATVTRGSVTQTVSVSGSVNASGQARLAFKTGGRLTNVMVSVGQSVVAGQALAQLDTTDLQSTLATAQQSLANAQASYQKQLLAANDTRAQLAETQRQNATDIANAQQTLTKVQTNYATAKRNFSSITGSFSTDLATYRVAINTERSEIQQTLVDLPTSATSDVNSARNALNSADGTLASVQGYADSILSGALTDYASSRDAITRVLGDFDAAINAGADTNAAVAAYQNAQLSYNLNATKLQSAIDSVTSQVGSAQGGVSSAVSSLNTQSSRSVSAYDAARTDLATAQSTFAAQSVAASTIKTELSQAGTTLSTITDAVTNGIANAITTLASTQERAASSLRSAQSAVANIPFNLQSAQVNVDNASTAVQTAQSNLDAAILTAPAPGIVASIANQVGEFVNGGGNTNAAFIVLTNTTALVLHGTVGEADVSKLKIGQVANITIDALTGQKMTGKVTSLDPVATIQQGVPVYGIDVTIDVPATTVKAGMSGTASVIIASKQNVLIVPNTAIRTVNGQRGVQVLKDGEAVDTVAQFGLSNDTSTEVVSGVAEGDVIVIPQARTGTATARPGGGFGGGGGPVIVPGRGG
ncbi:MAG TPA: biotin/lipoyl-binding protein [Candidatus Acidoferrales bacterium]|nr:biotin/lipoyl-binding protein [Candidatus Acidoferrales bacterium]